MWSHLKRIVALVSMIVIIFGGLQLQTTFADGGNKSPPSQKAELEMEPNGAHQFLGEVVHSTGIQESDSFEERMNLSDMSQQPFTAEEQVNQQRELIKQADLQAYTMADLNQLNYQELIDLLSVIEWYQISDLFEFNDGNYDFYRNEARMQALIDGLELKGESYTKDDSKGIDTLVEVIRAGFYLGFYNDELKELNERSYHDKLLPALKKIAKNSNFKLGTDEQNKVVSAYGSLIGNGSSDAETVALAIPILKQYNDNIEEYIDDHVKGNAVYSLMQGIDYDLTTYLYDTGTLPEDTMWHGNIDGFIDELKRFALLGTVTEQNSWLINNGIYYTGRLGVFHSTPSIGLEVATEAMNIYPYLSAQYFEAAGQIAINYGGIDAIGNTVDLDQIREDGKAKYLPKTYTFDDGSIIFKTGDRVTEEKVKRLYWAEKEVEAQFFRMIGSDQPLETGNADDVLTVVIYNSPAEYEFNRQLYGYETNNGGIYIEGTGTFFTYERTPEESIYSLEELFRHESTHYLQGRYEVPGPWGVGDIYQNDRLTWFEEGNAEFFAGATRTNSVVPRKSMIGGLATDPENRFTAAEVLYSTYGSFEFYKYAYALQSYMYNQRFDIFDRIHDLIRDNDIPGYDAYRLELSEDMTLNSEFQEYMQMLIDNQDDYTVPKVSDDYLAVHAPKKISDIKADIMEEINLRDVTLNKDTSQFFNAFTLQGTYTGHTSAGELDDWATMDQSVNDLLKQMDEKGWSGYKTLTAYFTNHRVNEVGQFEYDIVFHGINTEDDDGTGNKAPTAVINGPYNGNVNEAISFTSDGSMDEDGEIVSYKWEFGNGQTSTEENPSYQYKEEGTYTVKLTVTDDEGATAMASDSVYITAQSNEKVETEPNNSFETANKLDFNNLLRGSLGTENDEKDIFEIDVQTAQEMQITVTNEDDLGMSWVLHHETDLDNYLTYGQQDGDKLIGNYYAYPGKYYLVVYKHSGTTGGYTIEIE